MSEWGAKIIEETRKVATDNPNFLYEGVCRYVIDGRPACLIGHALWNLGLINDTFDATGSNGCTAYGVLEHLGLDVTEFEKDWLACAQSFQDSKHTWGDSVQSADEETAWAQENY